MALVEQTDTVWDLYRVAKLGHETNVLNDLVERAELGWRCQATLSEAAGGECCEYLNLGEDGDCQNCGASKPVAVGR
jgi:hypothetical protein